MGGDIIIWMLSWRFESGREGVVGKGHTWKRGVITIAMDIRELSPRTLSCFWRDM